MSEANTRAFDWPLRPAQRELRHAQGFSSQGAAIETHAVSARAGARAIPELLSREMYELSRQINAPTAGARLTGCAATRG